MAEWFGVEGTYTMKSKSELGQVIVYLLVIIIMCLFAYYGPTMAMKSHENARQGTNK